MQDIVEKRVKALEAEAIELEVRYRLCGGGSSCEGRAVHEIAVFFFLGRKDRMRGHDLPLQRVRSRHALWITNFPQEKLSDYRIIHVV